jgi:hypothetical protein
LTVKLDADKAKPSLDDPALIIDVAKIASPLAGIRAETGTACSTSALAPILFGFPLYRRCVRVLALDPMRRAPRTILGILAL